jgi:hypothetical protein
MSPASGNTPPVFGASDLRVDPQALWDVGLALQRVRDAAAEMTARIALAQSHVHEWSVPEALPAVSDAWRQTYLSVTESTRGLGTQTQALIGVLDSAMLNLRMTIETYLETEGSAQRRIAKVGE